uniref:Palm2 and akap2 fusion n=1 Tax=Salmo trutta TaxID=8032 RepID=A0A674BHI7_SALTR
MLYNIHRTTLPHTGSRAGPNPGTCHLPSGLPELSLGRAPPLVPSNAAALLVFNLPKFSHVTPLIRTLHWLPVEARIHYKTMVLAYGAARGTAPPYIQATPQPEHSVLPPQVRVGKLGPSSSLPCPSSLCKMYYSGNILPPSLPPCLSVCLSVFHPVMYAMEINVEKDRKTGHTRILSASAVSPDEVPACGVKVFDDGRKVVYEVRSGGSSTLDNGVHRWSSQQVDELMKRVGATTGCAQGGKAKVTVNPADAPSVPITTQPPPCQEVIYEGEVTEAPQATAEKPITMIFMGYHNVDDQDETKRLLGFDGTIKAEIVLIDEDDEKSLREKTVTDGYSTMDGNAADLKKPCCCCTIM